MMQKIGNLRWLGLGLALLCSLLPAPAAASTSPVAVFPLLDLSRGANGIDVSFTQYLVERLTEKGTEFARLDTVISFMSHNRIRMAGQLESYHIRQVQEELGAAFVLLGTIVQSRETPTPSLGLTLDLVRTYDARTIWSYVGSLSGADLRKPLGIGEFSSVAELRTYLVDDLSARWPRDIVNQERQGFVSIDSVVLEPKFAKPGTDVRCTVRLRNQWPESRAPKVFFKADDQLYASSPTAQGDSYAGTWVAGEREGRFPVSLLMEWPLYGRTETLPLGSYLVDGVAPLVTLDLKGERLQGDIPVFKDKVMVLPSMVVRKPLSRWRISFKTVNDFVVASEEQDGNLPERITWAGQNVLEGREVEGEYEVILEVWDLAGNRDSASRKFQLSSLPPEVAVTAEKEGQEMVVKLQRDSKVPLAFWRLEMWSEEGRLLKTAEGEELPVQVDVELTADEENRKIEGILVTEDVLGNKARREFRDLFPKAGSDADKKAESKTATETWVNEF